MFTAERRENISKSLRGKKNPQYGKTGAACPNYKTGRTLTVDGYWRIVIPADDPLIEMAYVQRGRRTGRILEHRYFMAQHIGRPLTSQEQVHHMDEDKLNNDISNLMLFPNAAAHSAHHKALEKECA